MSTESRQPEGSSTLPRRACPATKGDTQTSDRQTAALPLVEVRGRHGAYRPFSAEEMEAWRAFLAASTQVTASLNRELEVAVGISMHEYEILVRLAEAPDRCLRMSDLADYVSHSRSRLTHTVGRLEKEGYVERLACQTDRRGVTCHLTDAGLAFLAQAAPVHLDGVRRHVLSRLEPQGLEIFTRMLTDLVEEND